MMMMDKASSLKFHFTISLVFFLLLNNPSFASRNLVSKNLRCIEREKQALLTFKQGLEDESNWLSSWGNEDGKKECCEWEGVRCNNETGQIVMLNLPGDPDENKVLRGKIRPSLFELYHLKYLDLSYNEFIGQIPYQLGNLSHLQYLNLSRNHDSKVGNLKWLSYLSNLQYLDLTALDLSEVYDWLKIVSLLTKLSTLKLTMCDLPTPTYSSFIHINASASLSTIDLGDNLLTSSIFQWLLNSTSESLSSLDLYLNELNGSIPESFGKLNALTHLDLRENQLEGEIPKSFWNLCNLKSLDLSSNHLGVVISELYLSNFTKLEVLGLSSNSLDFKVNFNWVPPFQLRFLNIRSCRIGKLPKFPNWLQTQRNLAYLDISGLEISDVIPNWFSKWTLGMYYLNLSNNQIHGTLPNIQATIIDLSNNKFSGSILPLCNFSISPPSSLDLSNNKITGVIPDDCLLSWGALSILNLANNYFSGKIPSSMEYLGLLRTLDLHNNSFSGEIPGSMRNFRILTFMNMGDNKFSGKVPAWIGENLLALKFLILGSNELNGSIPLQLCQLADLQVLDLSHNNIFGTIPECLNNFAAMTRNAHSSETVNVVIPPVAVISSYSVSLKQYYIPVDYINKARVLLKGRADDYASILLYLRVIDLSNNQLTGKFSSGILNLSGLVALNLSRNNLFGSLPRNIGQLNQLQSLDLSHNHFSGEIPPSMSDLNFLSYLDLSYNKLSGKIPSGTQLQGFNASVYRENQALCGPPLKINCSSYQITPAQRGQPTSGKIEDEFKKWFSIGIASGFVAGFWGVCGFIFFNRALRTSYFLFLNKSMDRVLLVVALLKARLQRR